MGDCFYMSGFIVCIIQIIIVNFYFIADNKKGDKKSPEVYSEEFN